MSTLKASPPLPTRAQATPIRVLIVDDSVVLRSLLTKMLTEHPRLEVVGSARNGADALAKAERFAPDVVTMDVEMPEMDGMAALRLMQERFPKIKVVMCSSLTDRGAKVTIEALVAGASDYVTKQTAGSNEAAFEALGRDLRDKILHLFAEQPGMAASPRPALRLVTPPRPPVGKSASAEARILAIGVSTGGPAALATVIKNMPANFPLPIVIVQHMPPVFTRLLAERLSSLGTVPVVEAEPGMVLQPGKAMIAPGDFHLRLTQRARGVEVELNQEERENSCRPAVDVLFRSVAEVYGASAIAMVLTGMGQDGLKGARVLRARGAVVLAQDSSSSVVWGMPGAVVNAGLADAVLPLQDLVPEALRRL